MRLRGTIRLSRVFFVAALCLLLLGSSFSMVSVIAQGETKIVYVVINVDTEMWGGHNPYVGSTDPHPTMDMRAYSRTSPLTVAAVFDSSYRNSHLDSFGNTFKMTWFAEMDYLFAQSNFVWGNGSSAGVSGYTAIRDILMNNWGTEIQTYGDSIEYHHHFMIYDGAWEHYDNGPDEGYPEYQMYALDHMILDRNFYPSVFRSGWNVMPSALSNWLEQWMPFDYTPDTGPWYPTHPSAGMSRWQTTSEVAWITGPDVDAAFAQARDYGSAICSIYFHDRDEMAAYIDWLQTLLHKDASNPAYAGVRFKYVSAREAMQRALGFTDVTPPTFTVTSNGGTYTITSNEPLWQNHPYVALKYTNGTYMHPAATAAGTNTWTITALPSLEKIGVAASDLYGNTGLLVKEAAQHNLTVSIVGHGVTNATGTYSYDEYSNVTVLATPGSGYTLEYWTLNGSSVGAVNPYTINMTANFDLTAVFTPIQYSLTVDVSGNGSTNVTGTNPHDAFTNVTILATPDPGYQLDHWLLDGAPAGSDNPYTINMTDNHVLTAVFVAIQRTLTVSVSGLGSTNATGTHTYAEFTNVTVLATPDSGYFFDHWTVNGGNAGSDNPYTINMTADFDLTAVFSPVQLTLTVGVVGHGSTNATGAHSYDEFTNVTVLATPDPGWKLDHWTLNGTVYDATSSFTVNMTANYDLTAMFTPIEYNLFVGVSGNGGTNVTGTNPYDAFTNVTILATPDPGYELNHWLLDGAPAGSDNPYTINMTDNHVLTAVFVPIQYSLTVDVSGNGSTNVTGTNPHDAFTNVTVLAVPDSGDRLDYWLLDGVPAGSVNPYTVNMTDNHDLTAVFTPIQYSLVVTTVGSGSIVLNNTGPYYYGDHVLVTAGPSSGWSFDHWSIDLGGSVNPAVLTITGDMSVTAVFTQNEHSLVVNVVGHGSTNDTGTHSYAEFTNVTVSATPDSHHFFDYWLLNGINVGSENPYTINMTADFDLTAVFSAVQHSLTVSVAGQGVTNVTDTQSYAEFTNVTVLATPDSGWALDNWMLDGGGAGSVNPFTVNMTGDHVLTAIFVAIQYSLTVDVSGNGSTNVTGTNPYDAFTNVTVLAVPDSGYELGHWLLDGAPAGSDNPYTINMTGNFDLTAVFSVVHHRLTVSVAGQGSTNATGTQSYAEFINVTVLATPDPGWNLDSWVLNGTVYGPTGSLTVNMTANYDLIAVFNPPSTYVVVRGANNLIYYRGYNPTSVSWEIWRVVPDGSTIDSPAAVLVGNQLHLVVRGINWDQIWYGSVNLTDGTFSGWTQLSGATPSPPTLTANSTTLCLVVRGETNVIYYRFYDIAAKLWSDWASVPDGTTYDGPAATLLGGTLQVVVRGINHDQIWHCYVNLTDNMFSGWTLLSGATPSAPTLTANSTTLCLVVRGETNCIYYRFYDLASHAWSDWTPFPSYATPSNPASGATIDSPAATILDGTLQVVVRGANNDQIWHGYVNLTDNSFSGWTQLSGSTPSRPTLTS